MSIRKRSELIMSLALAQEKDVSISDPSLTSESEYVPSSTVSDLSTYESSLLLSESYPSAPVEIKYSPRDANNILGTLEMNISNNMNIDVSSEEIAGDCLAESTKLMSEQSLNAILGSDVEQHLENLPDGSIIDISYLNNKINNTPCNTSSQVPTTTNKRIRRKHNCLFCSVKTSNFVRHIERCHSDEIQVQEIMSLDKKSKKRKKLIDKVRREGDFISSKVVPVMNVHNNTNNYIVCKFCRGYYAPKSLRRHTKKCFFNPNPSQKLQSQIEGQAIMVGQFGPNDPLKVTGLLKMFRADDISFIAKKDPIICEVGRRYLKSHKEKHLRVVAKRQMRRLARLLKSSREILKNDKLGLLQILSPSKFQTLIKATKLIANYNMETRTYASPSFAIQMGTLIKNAINAAVSLEVQDENCRKDFVDELKILTRLIETDWAQEISSEAGQNLMINTFNKPSLIPAIQDIKTFENYLQKNIKQDMASLTENFYNETAYRNLMDCVYCSIILFNKRRVGELQRMTLEVYKKNSDSLPCSEFENVLSDTERILYSSLKRIVIRGKRGRGVPVLIDKTTVLAIDTLIKLRNNFELENNVYLFGLPRSQNSISGYTVMRKHAKLALGDVKKASLLTSTKLRKHLGTVAQIFRMEKNDLEQLAAFMGHTEKTHAEWYRLPDDIYQTAKVSKLLMLSKQPNIFERYKGLSLDEIDIDDYVVEENEEHTRDINAGEEIEEISPVIASSSVQETTPVSHQFKNRAKRKLVAWTTEQKTVAETFFKRHIKLKRPPRKGEVMDLINQHPNLFHNKPWPVIKVYICNKYKQVK